MSPIKLLGGVATAALASLCMGQMPASPSVHGASSVTCGSIVQSSRDIPLRLVPHLTPSRVVAGQYFGGQLLVQLNHGPPIRFAGGHLTAVIVNRHHRVIAVDSLPTTAGGTGGLLQSGRTIPLSFSGSSLSCSNKPLKAGEYTLLVPGVVLGQLGPYISQPTTIQIVH